jgi:hypothetical protein
MGAGIHESGPEDDIHNILVIGEPERDTSSVRVVGRLFFYFPFVQIKPSVRDDPRQLVK